MKKKPRALTIALLATALLAASIVTASASEGQSTRVSASPTLSNVNEIPDFYAEGTSGSYSLKVSPEGGYLTSSGPSIFLMPWGYVTAQWSVGTVYIIFLANVTEDDFRIAFLYLTNSSTPFLLRTFEYQGADLSTLTFTGIQYVFSRLTHTVQSPMPHMKLMPKATGGNELSAIGPELYLNGNSGQLLNESRVLKIYPLKDQLYPGANDYNEVWSLLMDDSGNFYFSILYMQNSNGNSVILEHQLRLNDYRRLDGRTLDAKWMSATFIGRLTVRLPVPDLIVKVDGFPFRTDDKGVASIYVPVGSVSVEVPNDVAPTGDTRYHFSSWSDQSNANPLSAEVDSALDLSANYRTQYLLTVETDYGEAQGSGWYDKGANATFTVPDSVTSDNGTRRVFLQWDGDYNSASNKGSLAMNMPKHVKATWKTQYEVKLELAGIPGNYTAKTTVNTQHQLVNGSETGLWVDADTQFTIEVQSNQIQGTTANYNFTGLRVDGQPSDFRIMVKKPITVTLVYSERPKIQSNIDIRAYPNSIVSGYPVTVTGSVPATGASTVNLFSSPDNINWSWFTNVTTRNDGTFTYDWKPNGTGVYFMKAFWPGDAQHGPASQVVSVHVQDSPLPKLADPNMPKFIQDILGSVNRLSFASALLGLAGSLLMLGVGIAALLVPGGSPILGYFLGSCLVGFIFVFPISALLFSLKAARTHRSPGVVWLTPLATIWIVTFAMLASGGAFFAIPPLLLEAATVLLISSNTLLVPLIFSLMLAKLVES